MTVSAQPPRCGQHGRPGAAAHVEHLLGGLRRHGFCQSCFEAGKKLVEVGLQADPGLARGAIPYLGLCVLPVGLRHVDLCR